MRIEQPRAERIMQVVDPAGAKRATAFEKQELLVTRQPHHRFRGDIAEQP